MPAARGERLRAIAFEGGGLLAVATLLVYAWLAPSHVVDGDNAEFATLGTIGGAAHPSGYPAYLLWLRATSWLPGTPAHAAALATAILGSASIWVLYRACRAWGATPLAATLAVVIFAGSPMAIRSGVRAEVFALNDLVAAAVLWLAAREGPLRGGARGFALGLVAGIGLANHLTCVLVAPIGILGVVRAAREARARALPLSLVGLAFGLSAYVYLLVTPQTALSWGKVRTFDDLIAMFTRRDFGGAGSFSPAHSEVKSGAQLLLLAKTLGRTWLWAPLAAALFAFVRRTRRTREGECRVAWALLAVSWVLAGPLLATRFNSDPSGLGIYIVERFHVLPAMLLAIPVAVGFTMLAPAVARVRLGERAACGLAATIGLVVVVTLALPRVGRVHSPAAEHYVKNVLRSLPRDAVLVCGDAGEDFIYGYAQWALAERQDVVVISPALVSVPWYAARLAARGISTNGPRVAPVIDDLLARGRPVFVELSRTVMPVLGRHPSYPFGPVVRVLRAGAPSPSLDEVLALNKRLYDAFDLAEPQPGPDDEFATLFHTRYSATWDTLANALEASGRAGDAGDARAVADRLGPSE